MKKFVALALILIAVIRVEIAQALTDVKVSGDLKEAFFINFPTPEGLHSFKFKKIDSKKYLALQDDADGLYFKGIQSRSTLNENNPHASADIVDGLLTVKFLGRRTGRSYQLNVGLDGDNTKLQGYLAHVSSAVELGCATGEKHSRSNEEAPIYNAPAKPLKELTLSLDADYSFYKSIIKTANVGRKKPIRITSSSSKKKTTDYMRSVVNSVNAIYSSQLGIQIIIADAKIDSDNIRSSDSISSDIVLDSFRVNVKKLNYLGKADLYHLFTGNRMAKSVVGLAYVGIACRRDLSEYSVGLSRLTNSAVQPLITAHEIAHNLGATHIEGTNSIMSPVLSGGKNTFIPTSVEQIMSYIGDYGICLAEIQD